MEEIGIVVKNSKKVIRKLGKYLPTGKVMNNGKDLPCEAVISPPLEFFCTGLDKILCNLT